MNLFQKQSVSKRPETNPQYLPHFSLKADKTSENQKKNTHSLIHTPRRRPIQIRPQIDPQTLVLAHIPRRDILPLDTLRTPSERIALVRERAERVLDGRESHGQVRGASTRRLAHTSIQFGALGVDQLDQLAVYDLELPGGCGGGEDRRAGGGVEGGCLQVFVEVWGGDGADPGVACLQGGACSCAGRGGGGGGWFGGGCGGARRG